MAYLMTELGEVAAWATCSLCGGQIFRTTLSGATWSHLTVEHQAVPRAGSVRSPGEPDGR